MTFGTGCALGAKPARRNHNEETEEVDTALAAQSSSTVGLGQKRDYGAGVRLGHYRLLVQSAHLWFKRGFRCKAPYWGKVRMGALPPEPWLTARRSACTDSPRCPKTASAWRPRGCWTSPSPYRRTWGTSTRCGGNPWRTSGCPAPAAR